MHNNSRTLPPTSSVNAGTATVSVASSASATATAMEALATRSTPAAAGTGRSAPHALFRLPAVQRALARIRHGHLDLTLPDGRTMVLGAPCPAHGLLCICTGGARCCACAWKATWAWPSLSAMGTGAPRT
ncbi:hypothetical protein OU995_19435 [Roseateles sp. SL47]|uniref:hypothetical protein n=1 Tax=Roseateles sp. SL47 TaxID=2995138 RepID=UPI00226DFF57|nr:hypothetical protein [Roseateles sp. SL47]WAC71740.1 hypothetical protein OU995_19435 [Roseateles sp. SL47]